MSSVLGGRSEVVDTSFYELLAHLDMQNEKERSERFGNFLNMFYANPMTDADARKHYIDEIKPVLDSDLLKKANNGEPLVTDLNHLRLLKQMQEQESNAAKLKGG